MHLVCSANFGLPCPVVNKFTPAQNSQFAAVTRDFAGKFEIDSAVRRCSGKAALAHSLAMSLKRAPGFQGGFTVDIEKKFEMVTGILWGEVMVRKCE